MAKKSPNDMVAKAETMIQSGRVSDAPAYFREAIRLAGRHPSVAKVNARLGMVLLQLGKAAEAISPLEQAERALATNSVRLMLVRAYVLVGRHEDGEALIRRVIEKPPAAPEDLATAARLLHDLGLSDEAASLLESRIRDGAAERQIATVYGLIAKRIDRVDDAIALMKPHTENASLPAHVRGPMLFALARLLDSEDRLDEAWEAAETANRLVRRPTDPDAYDRMIDMLINRFTTEAVRGIAQPGNAGVRAVLIVGLPRSGSTMIERMLGGHPSVAVAGEIRALHDALCSIPGTSPAEETPPLNRVRGAALTRARGAYLSALDGVSSTAERVTDKQLHNIRHLGLVPALLPGATVVRCSRELRDVALSCYFRGFASGQSFATSLEDIARFFRSYLRLMRHWDAVLPEACPEMRLIDANYEQAISSPESETARLVAGVGLEPDPEHASVGRVKAVSVTLEPDQQGQGVYSSSVGRWKRYEARLAPFIEAMEDEPGM